MLDLKNALEIVNEVVVIPVVIFTFFLLIYIVLYLRNKDPDIIRSKIFLKYNEFKSAFLLFALFAFVLILHVSLFYIPHFYSLEENPLLEDVQRFFGLSLTLIMITFVFYIYRIMK
jgi:hypothetical protein